MAARGAEAKNKIIQKMAEAFGDDWIGQVESKYYVWSKEDGERIQIAIALTCPKNPVDVETKTIKTKESMEMNFAEMRPEEIPTSRPAKAEISETERKNIQELMERLGL